MSPAKRRTLVVAFGGNTLLREGEAGTDAEQARHADAACRVLVDLVRRRYGLLVVHGNGPQVGNLLVQMEEAALKVPASSLDVAVALSQGGIGYLLERSLRSHLRKRGVAREVVTLLTMARVAEDAESLRPTKPIGPFLSRHRAREVERRLGWPMVEDAGRGWRRIVPSPRPLEVLNQAVVQELVALGHVVIAGGGGAIPVRSGRRGALSGVEAVIDKDYTAALLARALLPCTLVLLTAVPHVSIGFGTAREAALGAVSARELERHLEGGEFAEGSMRPKVEAILEFLAAGGEQAMVCDARSLRAALGGRAGTRVHG